MLKLMLVGVFLLASVSMASAVCGSGGAGACKTKIHFELEGILDEAPIEDLKKCSSCSSAATCGPCTIGINGWECRPAGEPSCVGCNNDCCSQCIFAGFNDTLYCGSLMAQEWTLSDVTSLQTEVDKIATVISLTAVSQSWVDVLQSIADVQGSDSFEFLSSSGAPVTPSISALEQVMYLDTIAQRDNIVWTASTTFGSASPSGASDLAAAFSGEVSALWSSKSNANLVPPRSGVLSSLGAVDLAQSPPPVLPLVAYRGVCKHATCKGTPGGTVDVPVVGGPGSLPGGLRK